MKRVTWCVAGLALALGGAGQAEAAFVTAIPGGKVHPMPRVNYFGPGPQTFGSGITITWGSTNAANNGGSVFGYTGAYFYDANGFWDGKLGPMAGLNDSTDDFGATDTMTFSFSTPQSAVGGFVNYTPGSSNPTTIAVYDSGHNLIESANLTFLTGGGANTGMFVGFQEPTADIRSFTLTDNYIGITRLTTGASSASVVPEPSSLALLGAAAVTLAGYAGWRRKPGAA